jgi:hypothetical protein
MSPNVSVTLVIDAARRPRKMYSPPPSSWISVTLPDAP